ncbi:MAG: TonB-dependent receptor [Flavitalea sp.]
MKGSPQRFLSLLAFVLPFFVFAQQNGQVVAVTGAVSDSTTGKPVTYATINVTDNNGKEIAATYSDEKGVFKFNVPAAGEYILEITSVGYAIRSLGVTVKAGGPSRLSNILLEPKSGELAEVTVISRRRLVEQKPGMLVYNAENDLTNKGGSAADVLRKAPVLNVDAQGNVSIRGNTNLKILINGKYSGQMARSPADALNMIPADLIRSVEVITTPSAKYDAEGAAGVINIITKKGRKNFSGTLEVAVSNLEQVINPRFTVNRDKWNINVNGHLHRLTQKEESGIERTTFENGAPSVNLQQTIRKKNSAPHGSADIVIDYSVDSTSELSLGITSWFGRWPDNSNVSSLLRNSGGAILEEYDQAINSYSGYLGSDLNLGYNKKFKRPGQELTLLVQFSPARDKSDYNTSLAKKFSDVYYREQNVGYTNNREWTFQGDYVQPISKNGKFIYEGGAKVILRNVRNNYDVAAGYAPQPDVLLPVSTRSDIFTYSQDVYAAYSMLKLSMKNNWYAEAGARFEETVLDGSFANQSSDFYSRFNNFIPTATVSKRLDDAQTLSLSYTKRITRPYIWDLNPNANASDPKNISVGNTALRPELAHQAELSYAFTGESGFFVNASLFWKQTDNSIVDITRTDENGVSVISKENLAGNTQYGLNLSSSVRLSDLTTLNGNINVNHLDFNSDELKIMNKGWGADFNINASHKLPANFGLQAFGEYNTRIVTFQGHNSNRYYYSFAAKKELPASKIIFTLSAVNPFNKYNPQQVILNSPSFYAVFSNRYYTRAVKLTVNWEFGQMFQNRERKKISNEDVKGMNKG